MTRKRPRLELVISESALYEGKITIKIRDPNDGSLHSPRKYLESAGFKLGDEVVLTLAPKKRKPKKK